VKTIHQKLIKIDILLSYVKLNKLSMVTKTNNRSFDLLKTNRFQTRFPARLYFLHYCPIGHEGSVGLSVCKVHISATRWRLFTLTAVALLL
jgi:hypothetical protein